MSTETTTPNGVGADVPSDINQRGLWPNWATATEWREKLYKKAAHKSLDIPDDDVQITNTKSGISTAGAVGIASAIGVPSVVSSAIMGYALLNKSDPPEPAPPAPIPVVAPVNPADSAYDVLFYDKDGNPINVPHISQRKAE